MLPEEVLIQEADRYFDARQYDRALELYLLACSENPLSPGAQTGHALSLVHLGRYAEAIPFLQKLQQLMPESDQLSIVLSEALHQCGRSEEAAACLNEVVGRSPSNFDAQLRLGRIYFDRGAFTRADSYFQAVLDQNPDNVEALTCVAVMQIKFCHFDDAFAALFRAYRLEPANIIVLNNLGRACKLAGRVQEALQWFRTALDVDSGHPTVIGNYLMALNYCDSITPEEVSREHRRLAPSLAAAIEQQTSLPAFGSPEGRIRVGYVSGDFYTHSVSYFFEPVLAHHDTSRFEIFCYSLGTTADHTTLRLKESGCTWRDSAGLPPQELARRIRDDRIDILVDLSGHTADNRLPVFAVRSAAVQISWIGYPNTSGLEQMDYYLTDSDCDPPGLTDHLFVERLWRLPRVFCCYQPPVEFPPVSPLPFASNGYVTFGSFNNFAKVTPPMISRWAELLQRVPRSRLYLKSMALGEQSVQEHLLAQFAGHGVTRDRIEMRTVTTTPLDHLEQYRQVDIALDTYPYHGTTTTCEALWMGVPVITRTGTCHASRVGVSLLRHVGCAVGIASDADDYVARAAALAADPAAMTALRERLRGMMARSALMDYPGFTRELEDAYSGMLAAQQNGRGPARRCRRSSPRGAASSPKGATNRPVSCSPAA